MTNRLMQHERFVRDFASLEEAVAECLRTAEHDPHADRERLISRFPRWDRELREFFADWDVMERVSSRLNGQRRALRMRAPTGTKLRYFGDYELLEEIGCGGMGVIFKARQISLDRVVALKMILDPRHDRERFRIEAEAAASLNHPNIVAIHEVGEFEGRPYFSMQYVDGGSLSDRLANGPLPAPRAAELAATIARAVHFAHQRGILHRDLKPANVLVDSHGRAYISDFGLAKQTRGDVEITQSGAILGTPGYMAPEQASGKVKDLTVATDVYGLGAILYAALIGKPPFGGQSSLETIRRVAEDTPKSLRAQRSAVPRDLETICLKCLEKEPHSRYASADAVADDLGRFLRCEPIKARPIGQMGRFARWCRRNPGVASLTAAVAVLLIMSSIVSGVLAHKHRLARKAADLTLADCYTTQGVLAAQHDNPHDAAFWFAAAADLAEADQKRVRENLIHLDSVRQQVLEPRHVLWLENAAVSGIQFDAASTRFLCAAGPKSVLWDFETDERWALADLLPEIRCAALSAQGDRLAVGGGDGRVVIADVDTRTIEHELRYPRPVRQLVFDPEGAVVAAAEGGSVHLFDCRRMQSVGSSLEHPRLVLHVAFSPAGDRIVTVCRSAKPRQGGLRVFQTGQADPEFAPLTCVLESDKAQRTPYWPMFVEEGRYVLAKHRSSEGTPYFRSYDVRTGQRRATYNTGRSIALMVAHDTRTILNCGDAYGRIGEIRKGDLVQQKERLVHRERITAADFSPDGRLVATGGWDRDLRLFSVGEMSPRGVAFNEPRKALAVLAHQTRVKHVKFSPDNRLLATVQSDGLIRIARVPGNATSRPSLRVGGGTELILATHAAQSAVTMATGVNTRGRDASQSDWFVALKGTSLKTANSSMLTVHGLADPQQVGTAIDVEGILMDAAFSSTGGQLATIHAPRGRLKGDAMFRDDGSAGTLRFWSWPDGQPRFEPIPMPAEPRSIAFRPDGRQLAVMCARGQVLLVDTQDGSVAKSLETRPKKLFVNYPQGHGDLRYTPDGRSLVAWSFGVWIWEAATGALRYPAIENDNGRVTGIDISQDSRLLAIAGGPTASVRVFDIASRKLLAAPLEHSANVFTARFSPDGDRILTTCRDSQARVFDWRTGELVLRGLTHDRDVLNAVFTPDGRFILSVGLDRLLQVWHADDGRLAMRPTPVNIRDREILVTPDSRYAAVTGKFGEVLVVSLAPLYETPQTNMEQVTLLGELLSNKTLHDGGAVKLTTSEWLQRWRRFSN